MSSKFNKEINSILYKFNSGKKEVAFKEIENLVQKNNKNISLITTYAIMAKRLSYESNAVKSFKYILEKEPSNILCLYNLYTIYLLKLKFMSFYRNLRK